MPFLLSTQQTPIFPSRPQIKHLLLRDAFRTSAPPGEFIIFSRELLQRLVPSSTAALRSCRPDLRGERPSPALYGLYEQRAHLCRVLVIPMVTSAQLRAWQRMGAPEHVSVR